MRALAVLFAATCAAMAQPTASAGWATDLACGGVDLWRSRVPVDLRNDGADAVAGLPVEVAVGPGGLPLTGARAQDLRVTDEAGTELLFDLRGPAGRLSQGGIPAGSRLTLPLAAAAGGRQRVWVYYDHPSAYPVPDYLKGAATLVNGSFEAGEQAPADWQLDGADAAHRIGWSTDGPRTGARCVKVEVDAGAEATWIAARQQGLAVQPGRRYRVSGWVKGRDVVGRAGWYIHVATPANAQAINRVEGNNTGSFDWRRVDIEFQAPDKATTLSLGTVLFGTGSAWFDDVTVTALDEVKPAFSVTVGPAEQLKLAEVGPGNWPAGELAGAAWRAVAYVANLGQRQTNVLVAVPAKPLLARLPKDVRLQALDPRTGRPVPAVVSGDNLLCLLADLPAATRLALPVYAGRFAATAGPALDADALVTAPGNLAPNPGFEDGAGEQPAEWAGGTEGTQAAGVSVTRVQGGAQGQWCGRTLVPAAAPTRWVGWRRAVPCEPNADYFFSARVKTENLSGAAPLYVHLLDDKGEWAGQRGGSTGTGPSGTSDWTTVSGIFHTAADTRSFEMHLTMNANGTVWHDAVVLRRAVRAAMGDMEARPRPAGGLVVWTEDPIVKVLQDSVVPPAKPITELFASRGERETLQVCLRSPADLKGLRVAATCGGLPVTVERVGFVPIFQPGGYFTEKAQPWERLKPHGQTRTDGWQGWWPDYLLPVGAGLDLTANRTQPLWVTVSVPREAKPGAYRGQVTLSPPTGPPTSLAFALTVWPFVQPERASLQVIYDQHYGSDHDAWLRFMADHRVCPDTLPSPKFELKDGRVTMDPAPFDKEAVRRFDELKMSAGYLPSVFYACGWAYPPRDFLGCRYGTPEYKSAYQQAVRLLWDHCKAKGWARYLTLYISDEPHFDRPEVTKWLGEVIGFAREAAPDITVYSSTWRHNKAWDGILNHWGVGQYGCFPTDEVAQRRKAGDKVWFTTDGQMEIDTPYAACERLLPWYCYAHDVSGYEFWGLSWYTYDPYRYGWHSFIQQADEPGEGKSYNVRYPNGDGYLAYPGEPMGLKTPVSSIRLEAARDGIEDYELFIALARLAADKPALAPRIEPLLKRVRDLMVIPNAGGYRTSDWLPDPYLPAQLRRQAGDLLTTLSAAP